jgi:hypothetical protein
MGFPLPSPLSVMRPAWTAQMLINDSEKMWKEIQRPQSAATTLSPKKGKAVRHMMIFIARGFSLLPER